MKGQQLGVLLQQWEEDGGHGRLGAMGNSSDREQQSVGWPKGQRWGRDR